MIECIHGDCSATKTRQSTTDHRSTYVTSFDYWATRVLEMISGASRINQVGVTIAGVSTSELFLSDPDSAPLQTTQVSNNGNFGFVDLYKLDPAVFSVRASILLNTGIQVFMAPKGFVGGLTTNLTLYGPSHIPADGLLAVANASEWEFNSPYDPPLEALVLIDPPFLAASTNATVKRYTEVYQPSYVWVVLLTVSAVLLLITGALGLSLHFVTVGPDIFDPVMGLTYTNPYMPAASQQDPLDAADRLRALKDLRVRLGMVERHGTVAGVAFGDIAEVDPLMKPRIRHG